MDIHKEFQKAGLTETIALQFTQWGRLCNVPPEIVQYINSEPGYEIALHGWGHFAYNEMEFDFIVRDLQAAMFSCMKYFGVYTKVWYTTWNCMSNAIERAVAYVGMEVSNESNDIWRFIREAEVGKFSGKTMYFHGWKNDEMELFPRMLELAKQL